MSNRYTEMWTDDCGFSIDYTEKIASMKSEFQEIDFYKSDTFGNFFTLDGLMMVNDKDEFIYHDMITHPAMAVNPNIKRVLIIGGGDGGTAREVLRHTNVEEVVMVEIDELVFRMTQQHMGYMNETVENDPRMQLIWDDGLEYVRNAKDGTFDLILVDSTDPISVGEGLFSTEFYTNCFRVLSEEGILINQHESPYFATYAAEMKKAHKKIKDLFTISKVYQMHMPTYPSGHWLFGFASKKFDPITDVNVEKWEEKGLKTKYYNTDLHVGAFMLPTYVREQLDEQ